MAKSPQVRYTISIRIISAFFTLSPIFYFLIM
jgi:hypothetical protein